jgi:hypothetical protein
VTARGRVWRVAVVLQLLSAWAVCAAPQASAASNAAVLNWTGLKDTYGVPIGDYYLSMATIAESVARGGPQVGWDPASWARWTVHLLTVAGGHWAVATILTGEAGMFVGITAITLMILRITVSTYWVSVIGEIARALTAAVVQVTSRLGLLLIAVPVGVFCGVVTIRRGASGRGATMILIALTLPALSVAVFSDPAGEMYGPEGLLTFGRRVGFSVAEAATHNGSLDPGVDANGQVDSLTASLITHVTREPLSLFNFGHVVDHVGNCGAAWSSALRIGLPDGPIHAMQSCGDQSAVAYAERLDGSNAWIGAILVLAAGLLGLFVMVSGWAVLKVSVKAVWTTAMLLPALWLGAVPGAPQRRAIEEVWEFFRHAVEVMVYIVYVSVISLAIERLVSTPLPAVLGGTNPFAHVLFMGATSVAALFLLRHVRAEMSGRSSGGRGLLSRATDVAVGMGLRAAVGGAASAGVQGARSVARRLQRGGQPTPWDLLDLVADARAVHGPARPGFEPIVSVAGDSARSVPGTTGERARRGVRNSQVGGRDPVTAQSQVSAVAAGMREEPTAVPPVADPPGVREFPPDAATPAQGDAVPVDESTASPPRDVDPIAEGGRPPRDPAGRPS